MNIYLCISKNAYWTLGSPVKSTAAELVAAPTAGKAKVLSQKRHERNLSYFGEFTDWRVRKVGEAEREAGVLSDDDPLWERA